MVEMNSSEDKDINGFIETQKTSSSNSKNAEGDAFNNSWKKQKIYN